MQIKAMIQKSLSCLGYKLARIDAAQSRFIPRRAHFDGGAVQFDYWITKPIYEEWYDSRGWAESAEFEQLSKLTKAGDYVLELGCNIGFTTMILSRLVGERGRVVGVDMNPRNIIVAQSNVFLNKAVNVHLVHAAVGASIGEIGFADEENGYVSEESPAKVQMTTCDQLDKEWGPFNIVKIDVEGYEGAVLTGAERLLARTPKIAIELHGQQLVRYGATVEGIMQLLDGRRYAGKMFTRPNFNLLKDFEPEQIDDDLITNVFLEPKRAS
ncbi:MAG: FkbM family methyltransferase [Xanthobacteraceae bacterium]